MFSFLKKFLKKTDGDSAPVPKTWFPEDPEESREARQDWSDKLVQVLKGWGSTSPGYRDPDGQPELFQIPESDLEAAGLLTSPTTSDGSEWNGAMEKWVNVVSDFLLGRPKTTTVLSTLLSQNAEYELLFVLGANNLEAFGSEPFTPHQCVELENALMRRLAAALVSKGEEISKTLTGFRQRGNRTLGDRISRYLYLQVCIVTTSSWRYNNLVYIAKHRHEDDRLSKNILVTVSRKVPYREDKAVLFGESLSPADRKDTLECRYEHKGRRGFSEKYWFFFSKYPNQELNLRVVDFYPEPDQQKEAKAFRIHAHKGYIGKVSVKGEDISRAIVDWFTILGEKLVEAVHYAHDAEDLYDWESKEARDRKGVLDLIAYSLASHKGELDIRMLTEPFTSHLETGKIIVLPNASSRGCETVVGSGEAVLEIDCLRRAGKAQSALFNIWESLQNTTPPQVGARKPSGLMVLLFRNSPGNPRSYSYQILRGSALKPAQQLRVDLLGTVLADGIEAGPEAFRRWLETSPAEVLSPDNTDPKPEVISSPPVFLREAGPQQNGFILQEAIYYIALGSASTGYLIFRLNPGSQAPPLAEDQAQGSDTVQTHARIRRFCENEMQIYNLATPTVPYTQGDLLIGEKDSGSGQVQRFYVKVCHYSILEARERALPVCWKRADDAALLPPGTQRHCLDYKYETCLDDDPQLALWLIATPEMRTLNECLSTPTSTLDDVHCRKIVAALRQFYRRAYAARLAFPDCSVEDLVLSSEETTCWLVDFGSYEPLEVYQPSPSPGKDSYRDPGLIAWLKDNTHQAQTAREAAHVYNLALLEFQIWGSGYAPPWPVQHAELAENGGRYSDAVETALGRLASVLERRQIAAGRITAIQNQIRNMTLFDPLARPTLSSLS